MKGINPHVVIECIGLDSYAQTFASDQYLFQKIRIDSAFIPFIRQDKLVPLDFDQCLFFADCIAYDHDIPVVAKLLDIGPEPELNVHRLKPYDLKNRIDYYTSTKYYDDLVATLESTYGMRYGFSIVNLLYDDFDEDNENLNFQKRFHGKDEALALYAVATRQADIMMEYLSLYRVVEWLSKSNGIDFINKVTPQIKKFKFNRIIAQEKTTSVNLMDVYKTDSSRVLMNHAKNNRNTGEILYGIRCSIAHGQNNSISYKYPELYQNVVDNLYLLKTIVRMEIERKT